MPSYDQEEACIINHESHERNRYMGFFDSHSNFVTEMQHGLSLNVDICFQA